MKPVIEIREYISSTQDAPYSPPTPSATWLRVLAIWLAAAFVPVLVVLVLGPPTFGGVGSFVCILIGFQVIWAVLLGIVGARAVSWWITLLGALPLALGPFAAAIIDEVIRSWTTFQSSLRNSERLDAIGFSFIVTLIPALIAHWMSAATMPRTGGPSCRKCNYNLTGNVSGKCPECGTLIDDSKILL